MPKEFGRHYKVAQLLKRELAGLLQQLLPAAEYGMITLTHAAVSKDLRQAVVYVTELNDANARPRQHDLLLNQLNQHAAQLRHRLSQTIRLRSVPILHFKYDHTIEHAERISELLHSGTE